MEENREDLEQMINYMFQSVFVHRYRDVVEDIRCLCLTELGVWVTECPDLFLEDSYLKYLGWPLSDKAECVRLCTIKSLLPMYENRDMADKMALFTEKFKERLHSMILDKNIEVAVTAIQLLQLMMSYQEDCLTEEQCEKVYMLVYSANKIVARAAANFLVQMQFKSSMLEEQVRTRRGKKRSPNTAYVRNLVQFYIESDQPGYEAYLVDSMTHTSMVKDWECMIDLLVEECGPEEEEFDQNEETALVTIMVETIKQVVTGEMPPGRGSGRKVQSAKEIKQMATDKELVTSHFMVMLPHVINKYLLDEGKMIKLLTIPQFMNIEMYTTSRKERELDGLLKLLAEVVEKHTDENVLDEAFKTLSVLCNPESSIYGRCNSTRDRLVDTVTSKMRNSWEEFARAEDEDEVGPDEVFDFENSLRKLSLLYKHHDPGHMEEWDILYSIVRLDLDKKDETIKEPEVAIISALTCCHFMLLWEKKRGEGEHNLREMVNTFIITCREAILMNSSSRLAEEAFVSICDLLVVFSSTKADHTMVMDLTRYMHQGVFDDEALREMEVSHDEEVQVDKISRQRNVVTCFCKLVVHKVIPAKYLVAVVVNYTRFFDKFGDIIKAAVGVVRDMDRGLCARLLLMSVVEFGDKFEGDNDDELRKLARRLAMLLGLDGQKNRQAIIQIHKQGISLALGQEKDRLKLLVGLAEFSGKILIQDRPAVLKFFNRELVKSGLDEVEEIVTYRNSLQRVLTSAAEDE